MKNVYIDSEFRCHSENTNCEYREFDVPFFYGKCAAFIEGYRYVPTGETWTRTDGAVFHGEMIAPFKSYSELSAAQAQYEADMASMKAAEEEMEDIRNALSILEVELDG